VEEEITIEEVEIEVMKIKEEEEEKEEEEMITEDIHLTVEAIAMVAEKMEKSLQDIIKIENTVEEEILDQIQDRIRKEDPETIDTAVRKERMDLRNL
jgi:ribosomal protein L24